MSCHDQNHDQKVRGQSRWSSMKGTLIMALCCGAPLLAILAFGSLGGAIGGRGLSFLAVLLCPLGMFLMMYLMGRGRSHREEANKPEVMAGMQNQPKFSANQDPAPTEKITALTAQVESLEETVRQLRGQRDGDGSQGQVVMQEHEVQAR